MSPAMQSPAEHESIEQSIIRDKLRIACRELDNHLADLSKQLRDEHRVALLRPEAKDIDVLRAAPPSDVRSRSCDAGDEFGEGEAYRCKCTFQMVVSKSAASSLSGNKSGEHDTSGAGNAGQKAAAIGGGDDDDDMIYVTRGDRKLCPLPNGLFPPANIRIRRAMKDLMDCLNRKSEQTYASETLRNNLTSVTFVTSWGDGKRMKQSQSGDDDSLSVGGDCLVTLIYGPPGLPTSGTPGEKWKKEAKTLCDECNFSLLTGRSKGTKISVSGTTSSNEEECDTNLDEGISEEGIIHDDLWLTMGKASQNGSLSTVEIERVSLVPPPTTSSQPHEDEKHNHVHIQYQKPATAFQHPNAGVMLSSLHWMLTILSKIVNQRSVTNVAGTGMASKPRLLEMYCGCGAHTMPLAKSSLLSEIVAVELDGRLVNACRHNCQLNHCLKGNNKRKDSSSGLGDSELASDGTMVQVFKGDAAEWAAKTLRRQSKQIKRTGQTSSASNCNGGYSNFDILLVDPPRDGLSPTVCDMALKGTFRHVMYVSCGRRALLRDLSILCGKGGFDLADLAVIDLFPGTDAVESLVHLKRRL